MDVLGTGQKAIDSNFSEDPRCQFRRALGSIQVPTVRNNPPTSSAWHYGVATISSYSKVWYVLLLACVLTAPLAHAAEVTYVAQASLNQSFGSLAAGAILIVDVIFDSNQSGQPLVSPENTRRFELNKLSLRSGMDSLVFQRTSGASDAWIVVGDDSPLLVPPQISPDFVSIRAEGQPSFVGTLGGITVDNLYLFWQDSGGHATDGYLLPTSSGTFALFDQTAISIQSDVSSGYQMGSGTIQSTSVVPLPTTIALFVSALSMLSMFVIRRSI